MKLTAKVFYNSLVQVGGKLIGTFLGLLAIAWFARYLGSEGFGYYTTATAFASLFAIVADLGLTLVASQMINQPDADDERLLGNLMSFRLISATLIVSLAPLVASLMPYSAAVKAGIWLAAGAYLFNNFNQIFVSLFQKYLRTDYVALSDVLSRLIWVIGAYLTVNRNWGLSGVFWTMVVANVFSFVFQYLFAKKLVPLKLKFDMKIWRVIMSKSWPLLTTSALNLIYLKADIVILSLMVAPAAVGLYGAAYKVVDVLVSLPFIFAGLVLPILTSHRSAGKLADLKRSWSKFFDYTIILALPLTIGGIYLSGPIMRLVAGPQFLAAGPILVILMIAVLMVFLSCVFTHSVISWEKQTKLIPIYLFTAVTALPVYYWGIKNYSYFGAAWGTVYSETMIVLGSLYIMAKHAPGFSWNYKRLLRITLSAAVMAGFLHLTANWAMADNQRLILDIVLSAAVYATMLSLTGALKKDDWLGLIGVRLSRPAVSDYENPIS